VRARGRRLLRGHRVEPRAHPRGQALCLYALQSVLPLIAAKQRKLDASDWLEQDSLVCPDPEERPAKDPEKAGKRHVAGKGNEYQ